MYTELADILSFCRDSDNYPDIFPLDFCKDIKLSSKPQYKFFIREPRTVTIEISSFSGYAVGAVHYYVSILGDSAHVKDVETNSLVGGYLGEEYRELCSKLGFAPDRVYRIEVTRRLTESDLYSVGNRWKGYEVGDFTNAFSSREEALELAKNIVKIRFPGWKVIVREGF